MYSICSETLAMALLALWVVCTPTQPFPQTMPVDYQTLPHLQAAHVTLGAQSEKPVSVELRVPIGLVHMLPTEEQPRATIDLRVPEALLEHLHGTE
jgi:hypothetical protein